MSAAKKRHLIVTAHPSKYGFAHKIASTYEKTVAAAGEEVEIIDLYKTDLKQGFLSFEEAADFPADNVREKIQAKISAADTLVFVFPLWWLDSPAILKNFFDQNFTSGFAYKFTSASKVPDGLLEGKQAKVFITCDAPKIFYYLMAYPFWVIWNFGRLRFCGLKVSSFTLFDKMRQRSEDAKEKLLTKVEKEALK